MGDYGFEGAGDFGGSDFPTDHEGFYVKGLVPSPTEKPAIDKSVKRRQLELEFEILEIEIRCLQRQVQALKKKLLDEL